MGELIGIATLDRSGLVSPRFVNQTVAPIFPDTRKWVRIAKQQNATMFFNIYLPWAASSVSGVDKYLMSIPKYNDGVTSVKCLLKGTNGNTFYCKEDTQYVYFRQQYNAPNNEIIIALQYTGTTYQLVEIKEVTDQELNGSETDVKII